jgi:hypothetical protein
MNDIENIIKNTKYPLVMLYTILHNNNIIDENKTIFIKLFLKNHILLALEYNLLLFKNSLKTCPNTFNIIYDVYNIILKQINILKYLRRFKLMYKNKFFWNKNIKEQIIYLKHIYTQFMSIFDGSKGLLLFHLKLKSCIRNNYHTEEIKYRLYKLYNLLKHSFFTENKILIMTNNEFNDLQFENMIKYTEYIYVKTNTILLQYISYFELYENYREQLDNILSITNNIYINDLSDNDISDIEMDDLELLLKN